MADSLPWPSVLMPSSEEWSVRGGTRSGGRTFQGNEQVIASPTSRWKASLTIPCWEPEHILAMRRVIALGRSTVWLVGPFERERAPWNIDPFTGGRITDAQGQADAALDPAWATNPDTKAALDFRIPGQTAVGDATIAIQRIRGGLLYPGMIFSLLDRLHMIVGLDAPDPGGQVTLSASIRPLLRLAYPAAQSIEFGRPSGRMRLSTDDTGSLQLELSRYGTVTVDLEEAL